MLLQLLEGIKGGNLNLIKIKSGHINIKKRKKRKEKREE